jgi:ketosteroid isomerase-like protein
MKTSCRATDIVEGKRFSKQWFLARGLTLGLLVAITGSGANASAGDAAKIVAALDTQYQAAVFKNDAATMDRILADDFVLVTGSGKVYSKADLLNEARKGNVDYEHQEDTAQTVRVWGDTSVVTAKLWEKGTDNGKSFDYTVWFSDTYVRTSTGWRYVFGQSSLPLPKTP